METSLDDLYYFSAVAEHGGFSAAARVLNVPKSRLSRRIAELEERLQVSLINRSTRQFSLTDIGKEYLYYCMQMTSAAASAQAVIDIQRNEPRGRISLACPSTLLNFLLTGMISRYAQQYDKVEFLVESTNREVNLLREGFDLAFYLHCEPLPNSNLVAKRLFSYPNILVASPTFLSKNTELISPENLASLPFLAGSTQLKLTQRQQPDNVYLFNKLSLKLHSEDMILVRRHAIDGLGIAILPSFVVDKDIAAGRLVNVLPDWQAETVTVSALFSARNVLLPSLRSFVDHLSQQFALIEQQGIVETAKTNGDNDACILIDD